jgi:hypothetical protein
MGAVFMSVGTEVQPALAPSTDGDASEELHLRLDDRAPAAPMALLDDDSLLMAARGPGDAAPAGLFLVRPN